MKTKSRKSKVLEKPVCTSDYLKTPEAADYLNVSSQWLEIGRHKGYGPPYLKPSGLVRYFKNDLDEYMKNHRRKNTIGGKG